MNRILAILLALTCGVNAAHVQFDVANMVETAWAGKRVEVTPSAVQVSGTKIIVRHSLVTNTPTGGTFIWSNVVAGNYLLTIASTPATVATLTIPDTNALVSASVCVTSGSAPPGYSAFVRRTEPWAVAAGTNITAVTNGALVTISSTAPGTGYSDFVRRTEPWAVAAGTNITAVTNGALVTISSTAPGTGTSATAVEDTDFIGRTFAGWPLDLPTWDNLTPIVHPNVIRLDTAISGFKWWMAMSPYPESDREKPSILCSTNGIDWRVPPNMTNYLFGTTANGWYTADPELLQLTNGQLALFWMDAVAAATNLNTNIIYRSVSSNGTNWSAAVKVLTGAACCGSTFNLLSPSILSEADGTLRMWAYNMSSNNVGTYVSTTLGSNWVWVANSTNGNGSAWQPWHLDVVRVGATYYSIDSRSGNWDKYLSTGTSSNGYSWNIDMRSIPSTTNLWAEGWYRASLVPVQTDPPLFDIYAGSYHHITDPAISPGWRVGLMRGVSLTNILPTLKIGNASDYYGNVSLLDGGISAGIIDASSALITDLSANTLIVRNKAYITNDLYLNEKLRFSVNHYMELDDGNLVIRDTSAGPSNEVLRVTSGKMIMGRAGTGKNPKGIQVYGIATFQSNAVLTAGSKIAIGTNTPAVQLHIVDFDNYPLDEPTIRLENPSQKWDIRLVGGQHDQLWFGDVTHGVKPVQFYPQTSNDILVVRNNRVGIKYPNPLSHDFMVDGTSSFGSNVWAWQDLTVGNDLYVRGDMYYTNTSFTVKNASSKSMLSIAPSETATFSSNVVAGGQFIGNGAGLTNHLTNVKELRFVPVTNGPGFSLVQGTGVANADGSYDETMQWAYNQKANGNPWDTNDHQFASSFESNFRQSDGTNYAEWNLGFAGNQAANTNTRAMSWNGNLTNMISTWGFAGARHFWNRDSVGDGSIKVDWNLTPIVNSNTFDFDGKLIADYSRIWDQGNYISSWYRSPDPSVWNYATGERGWIGFFGTQFTIGLTNVVAPIGFRMGSTNVLYFSASMSDMDTTAYSLNLGTGNYAGDGTIRTLNGNLTLLPGGSGKYVILTAGAYVSINGGKLLISSPSTGTPTIHAKLQGGGNEEFVLGPNNAAITTMNLGMGAINTAYGQSINWNTDETIFKMTNGVEIARFGTNGALTIARTVTATNGYFMPTNALTGWPTAPRTHGEAYWGNSNGVVYLLTSVPGSLTWSATNKIAP